MSEQKVESFDDMTPIEPTAEGVASPANPDGLDTFDYIEPKVPEEPSAKQEVKEEKKDSQPLKDKQINQIDDKEAEPAEEKSDGEPEDDKGKEGEEKGGEEAADKGAEEPAKPNKKTIKGKVDGETYELDPDTELRVSVKGKKERVSIQELMNNYSGKTNWDREYSKLGEEKTQFKKELDAYKSEFNWLKGHLDTVGKMLETEDTNPLDAFMYFLDVTGRDPIQYQQKIYDSQLDMLRQFDDMDEVERELYWEKRKNESLLKRQQTAMERQNAERERQNLTAKVDQLRQTHGISEEQYVEAHKELIDLGFENLSPEAVVDYAYKLPSIIKAEDLVEPFKAEVDPEDVGKLISDITTSLLDGITEEEITKILTETFGDDDEVEALENKVKQPKKVVDDRKSEEKFRYGKSEGEYESFEDFGYY